MSCAEGSSTLAKGADTSEALLQASTAGSSSRAPDFQVDMFSLVKNAIGALGMDLAKGLMDPTIAVGTDAGKVLSGVTPGFVGRGGVIFVPKVAQGKSSTLFRFGVRFAKAIASGVGALGGRAMSDTMPLATTNNTSFILGLPAAIGTLSTMPPATTNNTSIILGLPTAGGTSSTEKRSQTTCA